MKGADLKCECGSGAVDVAPTLTLERGAVSWHCENGHLNISGDRPGYIGFQQQNFGAALAVLPPDYSLPSKDERVAGMAAWALKPGEGQFFGLDRIGPPLIGRTIYARSRWRRAREWFARVVLRVVVE